MQQKLKERIKMTDNPTPVEVGIAFKFKNCLMHMKTLMGKRLIQMSYFSNY